MSQNFRLTAPVPAERDVHKSCVRALDVLLLPPAFWFSHTAGASVLSPQQAARHIELGLKRGLPDLWILYQGVYCIELKRPKAQLTSTRIVRTRSGAPRELLGQDKVFPRLLATGAVKAIAVCYTVDEVLSQLDRWEIPRRRTS